MHLRQLNSLVEFGEHSREQLLRQIEQVGLALEININDWKEGKMSSEATLQLIETWTPSITVDIEN